MTSDQYLDPELDIELLLSLLEQQVQLSEWSDVTDQ